MSEYRRYVVIVVQSGHVIYGVLDLEDQDEHGRPCGAIIHEAYGYDECAKLANRNNGDDFYPEKDDDEYEDEEDDDES